jgi:hypothetical protein
MFEEKPLCNDERRPNAEIERKGDVEQQLEAKDNSK